jgi:superfamily I DNA/RNA helicase
MAVKEDKYTIAKRERQEHIDAVLQSPSKKKIVVAGPGTGKTYLFKKILEGKKNTLTLTFVNSLVEDLSLELCGLSDVKTLHSFARGILKAATRKNVKIHPKLSKIVNEDAKILLNEDIDFDQLFHNRCCDDRYIEFYKKRKDYYGHYGYSDIVFGAVKYLEGKSEKVPLFGQVVVDEFQDFNKLEVSLIDLLAQKNPILLAGDDDQALYESLKSASAEHIRHRFSETTSDYEKFSLPYCSRCTRVIVDAVNDIIKGATQNGYLRSRISKPFQYFHDEKKDCDCDQNPQIIYCQLYRRQIPWLIQKRIEDIAKEVRDKFTVLIISPTRAQCRFIVGILKDKGFQSVRFVDRKDTDEPTLLDGLKLLLEDGKCNLGWRIVARLLPEVREFETLLEATYTDDAKNFPDLIGAAQKKVVSKMLKMMRAVKDGRNVDDEAEFADFLKKVDIDTYGMGRDYLKEELRSGMIDSNAGIRKIPITATTIQSSKGLAADYVFITHFDDQYIIKNKDKSQITDQDICNFLVALTRARKKVFLLSSDTAKRPVFLNWIDPGLCVSMRENYAAFISTI